MRGMRGRCSWGLREPTVTAGCPRSPSGSWLLQALAAWARPGSGAAAVAPQDRSTPPGCTAAATGRNGGHGHRGDVFLFAWGSLLSLGFRHRRWPAPPQESGIAARHFGERSAHWGAKTWPCSSVERCPASGQLAGALGRAPGCGAAADQAQTALPPHFAAALAAASPGTEQPSSLALPHFSVQTRCYHTTMARTRGSSKAAPHLRVAFLHPDLGLGGEQGRERAINACRPPPTSHRNRFEAMLNLCCRLGCAAGAERLIVDAAVELAGHGHTVRAA